MFPLENPLTYHQVFRLIAGSFCAASGWSVLQTCSLCLTSVTVAKYVQAYPEESVSAVVVPVRDRDDDWFLLLDVVPRETTYVPPGTRCLEISPSSHLL